MNTDKLSHRLPMSVNSPAFINGKAATYRWMLEDQPVCPVTFFGLRGHFVCRYEDCDLVLRDPRFRRQQDNTWWMRVLPRSWGLAFDSIINQDNPDHKRLRGFISAAFTPRSVRALEPGIQARTDRLLHSMAQADAPVDLLGGLALPLPAEVIGELLGIEPESMEAFVSLIRALVSSFRGWGIIRNLGWDIPKTVRFVDRFIEKKRATPDSDGLIAELIRIEMDGDRLSNDELVGIVLALIIGGFETTTHLISTAMVALCTHPDALAAVREDPERLPAALEEVMRFSSPVYATDRMYPTEPVTLHGVTLAPGKMVLACLGAANRDPRAFEDPDVFDISRTPNRHLGFGRGAHYCVGAALARAEARIAVGSLLERFPKLRLAVPAGALTLSATPPLHAYEAVPLLLG